jgi:hypothetical protein
MSLVLWFYTVGGAGAIIVAVMHQLTHGKVEHKQLSQATICMTPKWKLRLVRKMMNSAVFGQVDYLDCISAWLTFEGIKENVQWLKLSCFCH